MIASEVITRCAELKSYWSVRNDKMREWYRLIEMVDELKTEKMESFVGNDPRSMYNLVLHLLDSDMPHRVKNADLLDQEGADAAAKVSDFLKVAWEDNEDRFRKSGPHQSQKRHAISLLLATGWVAMIRLTSDDGTRCWADVWHPAEVYPMWNDMGLSEVAHIYTMDGKQALRMVNNNGWKFDRKGIKKCTIKDYWVMDYDTAFEPVCWNYILIDDVLVKAMPTRFRSIPIEVVPVGGLPDMGALTDTSAVKGEKSERWKGEIGQAVVATNENIYRTWNKWWTYGLQLLRDTAQPRIFERSQSGKPIVKPEDVFRRGAIFRGGPNDDIGFLSPPPMPLELRSTQLDLEAMMQRGGVSWAMYGNIQGQLSAFVMSQIAASANQIMKPFHQAIINLYSDIDNAWIEEVRDRGIRPYNMPVPKLPANTKVTADYEIEIPGDLVQRATVARMLTPDFELSYSYTIQKLFPNISNPLRERAQRRADQAESNPINAMIAYVQYCRKQANYLRYVAKDEEGAGLYELAASAALAQISPPQPEQPIQPQQAQRLRARPEALPPPREETQTPV